MSFRERAFDYVEAVRKVETLHELETVFRECVAPEGVTFFLSGMLVKPGGVNQTHLFVKSDEVPWFRYYQDHYLFLEDAAARISITAHQPFTWRWVTENVDLTESERRVFTLASEFGLEDGIVIPIHGAEGALGGGTVAGQSLDTDAGEIAALQIIMEHTYYRGVAILNLHDANAPALLSARQRECLNWAQHGKSFREIAQILGISDHTVKEHIDAAKAAFGVRTRIEAVMRARQANLIGFSPLPADRRRQRRPSKG